jgi:hypothetical protein
MLLFALQTLWAGLRYFWELPLTSANSRAEAVAAKSQQIKKHSERRSLMRHVDRSAFLRYFRSSFRETLLSLWPDRTGAMQVWPQRHRIPEVDVRVELAWRAELNLNEHSEAVRHRPFDSNLARA